MNRDELAVRLLATFVAELAEQTSGVNQHLLALESGAGGDTEAAAEHLRALFRVMHTLKGAARAAGVPLVETVCHHLESLLAAVRDGARPLDAEALSTLFAGVDALADAAERLRRGAALDASAVAELAAALADGRPVPRAAPPEPAGAPPAAPSSPERGAPPERTAAAEGAAPPESAAPVAADVRVSTERVDELLASSSRLLIATGRVSATPTAVEAAHDSAMHAALLWRRAREELRRDLVERGGALALLERLEEMDEAMRRASRASARAAADARGAARALALVTTDIADGVRGLRMRPFGEAAAMLPRLVRDAAAATSKQVRLELAGEAVQADRAVLDELRDALMHLVRNAVAHGIESPEVRVARGKPAEGVVRVSAALVGDHLGVTVADDGAGIDVDAVRARQAERGDAPPADDRAVARALFRGGLTTQGSADAIAGRGVGLDAVRAALGRVRGSVDVWWEEGRGTTFVLDVPVSVATVRALLVGLGPVVVAIPMAYVLRMMRLAPESVRVADGRPVVSTERAPALLVSLARLLGPPLADRAEGTPVAVLLGVGARRLAVAVEELLGEAEVAVRPIVARGAVEPPFVNGAALLPSGAVALVANVPALVSAGIGRGATMAPTFAPREQVVARRRVLVADDSITTRTLEQSVLEAAGYDVLTAADGADAWRVLQERGADLVVSDVEMPRMDGFALCEAIRASPRFRELPVILVTALETPEHRARGLDVGADAYLGKSSFDQETLLDTIRQLLGAPP